VTFYRAVQNGGASIRNLPARGPQTWTLWPIFEVFFRNLAFIATYTCMCWTNRPLISILLVTLYRTVENRGAGGRNPPCRGPQTWPIWPIFWGFVEVWRSIATYTCANWTNQPVTSTLLVAIYRVVHNGGGGVRNPPARGPQAWPIWPIFEVIFRNLAFIATYTCMRWTKRLLICILLVTLYRTVQNGGASACIPAARGPQTWPIWPIFEVLSKFGVP